MKLTHKIVLLLILLSIPFNFILFEGIGNVYLSTVILITAFMFLFIKTDGKLIGKPNVILTISVLIIIVFTTYLNVFFNSTSDFKAQSVGIVIYTQNFLGFIVFYYLVHKKSLNFFLKAFVAVTVLSCLRVICEETDKIFLFSTRWGERLDAYFIGAMNNFALICGIALFISLFYIKEKWIKIITSAFLFFMIAASMSRGAFLGVLFTFFIIALYRLNKKTLKSALKLSLFSFIVVTIVVLYLDQSGEVIEKIQDRFLSVFSGEKDLTTFSSGRFFVWEDILTRFTESNIFEILFGLGVGSIDFKVDFVHYYSSHNIFIDLLYKNGLFGLILYILILIYIFISFLKNKIHNKRGLFAIFIFLQFEIMFNPFPFAAQTGWIYFVFLAVFIKQNQLTRW